MPEKWVVMQNELAQKIIKRMRELNMKPVLPTFSGFVPDGL